MIKVFSSLAMLALVSAAQAQDAAIMTATEAPKTETVAPAPATLVLLDAADVSLDDFLWTSRPIVVFADNPADPRFREQIDLLTARPAELLARDVVVIVDSDPAARSSVRIKLRPRGFQLTLIGKDGRVNLRKPLPWDVREITRAIDKWPLRQDEIRAKRSGE